MIVPITVDAYGKINWTLDILSKRSDGFHEIRSVMQRIELADRLTFTPGPPGIRLTVTGPEAEGVPADHRNIVWRAARALGVDGVDIEIYKNLPSQAGLGGGSSDGAAALTVLNTLFSRGLGRDELLTAAGELGADVSFFLLEGTARVEGFGEKVIPIEDCRNVDIVVLKPEVGVSTIEAYNALDRLVDRVSANATASWPITPPSNDFEDVVYSLYPEVFEAGRALRDAGAKWTLLCGSGAAVMGGSDNPSNLVTNLLAAGYKKLWRTRTIP